MTELNRLLQTLCDADIDFIVVRGFAAMLHGSSMLTRDLDVCAVLTDASIAKLRTAFRDLHPTHRQTPQRLSFLDTPDPGVPFNNIYLQTDLGSVDIGIDHRIRRSCRASQERGAIRALRPLRSRHFHT
jgi:hypothetical protein